MQIEFLCEVKLVKSVCKSGEGDFTPAVALSTKQVHSGL